MTKFVNVLHVLRPFLPRDFNSDQFNFNKFVCTD